MALQTGVYAGPQVAIFFIPKKTHYKYMYICFFTKLLPVLRAYPKLLGSVKWGKQEDVLATHRLLERSSAWDSR